MARQKGVVLAQHPWTPGGRCPDQSSNSELVQNQIISVMCVCMVRPEGLPHTHAHSRRHKPGNDSGSRLTAPGRWAKNLSDTNGPTSSGFSSETVGGRVADNFVRRGDRGKVGPTRRQRWISTALHKRPLGRGKRFMSNTNPILEGIAGGWRLSSIFLWHGGQYLTATVGGGDPSGTNANNRGRQRPAALGDGNLSNPTADVWFNRNPFVCPGRTPAQNQFNCTLSAPIGRFGNCRGWNVGGTRLNYLDFSGSRDSCVEG